MESLQRTKPRDQDLELALRRALTSLTGIARMMQLGILLSLAGALTRAEEAAEKVTYLTDMSRCTPRSALAAEVRQNHWQLISYKTVDSKPGSGKMIFAPSYVAAPEVRLRLGISGWHAVYVGYWNPHYAYDDGTTVKVKLTGDPCFTRLTEEEPPLEYNATRLKETFFTVADLTGRDLVFGKVGGPFAQKACIAFVKLVPLAAKAVAAIQVDRSRSDTRVVQATIDGISYFWSGQYSTKEHVLELVDRYRHSDVGKVIWAINYGDTTNYPSKAGVFWARDRQVPIALTPGNNSYLAGEKAAYEGLRKLVSAGIIPEKVVGKHVHELGLQFDIMLRLAILGAIPPMRTIGAKGLVEAHPEFRQVMADDTPVEKASYAFPQVRALMLSLLREAAESFDVDGANLCFVRGPHFMQYEKPVLEDFRKEYGTDGRGVPFSDLRMRKVRCSYLTTFVRDARRTLDDVGKKKGKRLELSAWVPRTLGYSVDCGMDMETWMREGLLDSLIIHGGPLEPRMLEIAKANHCKVIYFPYAPPGSTWSKEAAEGRKLGVEGFAMWDLDTIQDYPERWAIVSRLGHGDEAEGYPHPVATSVQLKSVGGFDVLQGLGAAVYSGG